MKKIIFGLFAIALIGTTVLSCKKDKPKKLDCKTATANFQKAMTDYEEDQSATNCQAFKKATQDLLNSECADQMTAEQKAEYQEGLNSLNCN